MPNPSTSNPQVTTYKVTVNASGRIEWRTLTGLFHRLDGPAITYGNGDKSWYNQGELHRDDGPAIECIADIAASPNGCFNSWYRHGLLHRIDGPAQEFSNGTKKWYFNGELHRIDGPAIEGTKHAMLPNGFNCWYRHGKLHRIDGPAQEFGNGTKRWYFNGKVHRHDGPAVEYINGDKEWYLKDKRMSQSNHARQTFANVLGVNTDGDTKPEAMTWDVSSQLTDTDWKLVVNTFLKYTDTRHVTTQVTVVEKDTSARRIAASRLKVGPQEARSHKSNINSPKVT